MNFLRLTFRPEDEYHGELFAVVESDGFAGTGSAWFGTAKLHEFSERLGAYPLRPNELPVLEGGFWDSKGKIDNPTLTQTHLSVKLKPHNSRGAIQVRVTLATPIHDNEDAALRKAVNTWFVVSYNDLSRFQDSLRKMLEAGTVEATLVASARFS